MKKFVNALTITRVIGTLLLPLLWVLVSPMTLLIIVFSLLLTDFFDGLLARKFKVQSLFGAILDVIADKAFGVMMLILIGHYEPMFYLVAIMEVLIALINIIAAIKGATTFSSVLGKIKTWLLGFATLFALLGIFDNQLIEVVDVEFLYEWLDKFMQNKEMIIIVTSSMTIGAQLMVAIDYIKRITKEIKTNKKKIEYKFKSNKELAYVLFDTEYYINNKKLPLSKHLLK